MLGTLGGMSSGLGMAGGMGSAPGDVTSSQASSTATITPSTTVSGVGGGGNVWGPFNISFPGAMAQPTGAINRAPLSSSLGFSSDILWYAIGALGLILAVYFFRR